MLATSGKNATAESQIKSICVDERYSDFKTEAEAILTDDNLPQGRTKLIFESTNIGTFINSLPPMKGSGKTFWFLGFIEFMVRGGDNMIELINEYIICILDDDESAGECRYQP